MRALVDRRHDAMCATAAAAAADAAAQLAAATAGLGASLAVAAERPDEEVWAAGDTVDIVTEDGLQLGATVLGPSMNKNPLEMHVRFAGTDGTAARDDWVR